MRVSTRSMYVVGFYCGSFVAVVAYFSDERVSHMTET